MPDWAKVLNLEPPVVSSEEVFAVSPKIRWVAITSDRGDVLVNQMRPGVESYSPPDYDEDFVRLGPLALLGIAERDSMYLRGVHYILVSFGRADCVYARIGSQVISISIEKDINALSAYLEWLKQQRAERD